MPQEGDHKKKEFADLLAAHCQQEANSRPDKTFEEEIGSDGQPTSNRAQITFLRRIVPWWFMKPLKSRDGGAMRKGSANEGQVIKSLHSYVAKFSS